MTVKSLASIDVRIRELKAELQASAAYQELAVLEEIRPRLAAINGAEVRIVSRDLLGHSAPQRNRGNAKGTVTQHEAAGLAVRSAGHPLTIEEIVAAIPAHGGHVTKSRNTKPNLTSVLSKRGTLEAIRWQGKRAWWFKSEAPPE